MALFQHSVQQKYIQSLDPILINKSWAIFKSHFHNTERQKNIKDARENQYQQGFLINLFVDVLGYSLYPNDNSNLTAEYKNENNNKRADGAIIKDGKTIAVIELKATNTPNLDDIENQAFQYKNNHKDCEYVITSNYEKLRFYISYTGDQVDFNLFTLNIEEFKLLYLCLHKDNIFSNLPQKIKKESITHEVDITKILYSDYSAFKKAIFENIVSLNPQYDTLLLYRKTQKLLDRFLFIFFAEDSSLIPGNFIRNGIIKWESRKEDDYYAPLYDDFKKKFTHLDKGYDNNNDYKVFAYNGGLFELDEVLDTIKIDDEILKYHTLKLSDYNYTTDVDVNILGHIFEHSLNEIEEVQSKLEDTVIDKSKTKRKKDGVFYTPTYITKYIVDSTLGLLCNNKKKELLINDEDFAFEKRKNKRKELVQKLNTYRNWLLDLTICDPACGSGAFLNQALKFLINEHKLIDELQSTVLGENILLSDIENSILENNLYGVDLNDESVEIAKLSLWLRTAQKGRKLTTLNNNIKCGNSLIDDPLIAGEKAFNWQNEFPDIFAKGGFDIVIGNPPYGIFIDNKSQEHFNTAFPLTSYKTNLYILFIERMLQIFTRGTIHFIIPKSLLFNSYYEAIRKELILKTELLEIFTITEKVFEDAEVGGSLLLKFNITKSPNTKNVVRLSVAEKIENFTSNSGLTENHLPQDFFLKIPNCEISVVSSSSQLIVEKLNKHKQIKDFYSLKNGLNPGNIKHILISDKRRDENHKPIIWGRDISKYRINWSGQYINYDPLIATSLSIEDIKSKEGMNKQSKIDFALRTPDLFENKKIVIRKTGDSLIGCIDESNYYFDTLVHGIYFLKDGYTLEALLAILNSKTATIIYRLLHDIKGKVFAKISLDNLGTFPLPEITKNYSTILTNYANEISVKANLFTKEVERFNRLLITKFDKIKISNSLISWHDLDAKSFIKELKINKIELSLSEESRWIEFFNEEKNNLLVIKNEIEIIETKIDNIVYQLYELTPEEIDIIKSN